MYYPQARLLLLVLCVLGSSALAPVDQATAEQWRVSLEGRFQLTDQNLLLGDPLRTNYLSVTQIITPIVGEQQVALLGVQLTSSLNQRLNTILTTRESLIANWGTAARGNISTVASENVVVDTVWEGTRNVSVSTVALRRATRNSNNSDILNTVWPRNRAADTTIKYQYFGGVDGSLRYWPAFPWASDDGYDPRDTDWFAQAVVPRKKVIVLIDSTKPLTAAIVRAVKKFLSPLAYYDFVGVVWGNVSAGDVSFNGSGCDSASLIRATAESKAFLASQLDSKTNSSSAVGFSWRKAFERAFALLGNGTTLSEAGYHPLIALFSSNSMPDILADVESLRAQYGSNPRIFTFTVGSSSSADSFNFRRLACLTDGAYFESTASNTSSLPSASMLLQLTPSDAAGVSSWIAGLGLRTDSGLGLVLTLSVPVIKDEVLLGVLGMDFVMDDLQAPIDRTIRQTSYGFIMSSMGDTLVHPRLNTGRGTWSTSGVTGIPYMRDITTFETAPEFASHVRNQMLSSTTGTVNFDLDRLLPQGDAQFNYARAIPIHAYYFWQRLTNLPFVVVLTYAEEDLFDYDYNLHLSPNETLYFVGFKDLPSKYLDLTTLNIVTASDGVSKFALDFYTHQSGPTSLSAKAASFANLTFFVELHRFLNELNDPGNPASNPGVYSFVKSEGMVQKKQEPYWKAAWAQYATQFDLQLLYLGTPSSILGQYPAPLIPTLLWYNPSRRPWYQLAVANSGSIVLTAPYVDAIVGNTVSTISRAIYSDSSNTRLIAVVSVDLTYPPLHSFLFGPTGCRLRQADVDVPACLLFDESGILTTSFRFYDPIADPITGGQTPIENVFLGEEEPELAEALISRGVIVSVTQDDYSKLTGARRTQPYKVIDSLLKNGTLSGSFSSPCQQGSYFLMKVAATNMYMTVIHSYVFNGRNLTGCPSFSTPSVTSVPYEICRPSSFSYSSVQREDLESSYPALETLRRSAGVGSCDGVPRTIKTIHSSDTAPIVWMVVAAATIVLAVLIGAVMFKYRTTPVVRSSNEFFIYLHLLGVVIGISTIFALAGDPSKVSCVFFAFLGGIGFVLTMGTIISKLLRVQRIISNTSLVSVPISTKEMFMYTGMMVAVEVIFLLIWQVVDTLEPGVSASSSSNSFSYVRVCKCKHQWVYVGIQLALFAFMMLGGCLLCFSTRRVHNKIFYSELRWITYSIFLTLLLGIILVVLRAVTQNPTLEFILSAFVIWLMAFSSLVLIYGLKLYYIFLKPKMNVGELSTQGSITSSADFNPEPIDM